MKGRHFRRHAYNGIRYTDWEWHKENDPQLYKGSRFSLATGELLNKRGDMKRVRHAPDTEWRRLVTEYGKLWRMYFKLGALTNIAREMAQLGATRGRLHGAVQGEYSGAWLERIIREKDMIEGPKQILIYCTPWWQFQHLLTDDGRLIKSAFQRAYTSNRDAIRKHLGCFTEVPELELQAA
jgi:hypothetical protein